MAEQMRQGDDASDQVLAALFGQTRLDAHAGMTSNGHLTAYATPGHAIQRRHRVLETC